MRERGARLLEWAKSAKEWLTIILAVIGAGVWVNGKIDGVTAEVKHQFAINHAAEIYMPKDSCEHAEFSMCFAKNDTQWNRQTAFNTYVDTILIRLRTELDQCEIPLGLK